MNDKELADKVMRILDTDYWSWDESMDTWIELHGEDAYAEMFVRDWRVAGALMEECRERRIHAVIDFDNDEIECTSHSIGFPLIVVEMGESLPRAITESCMKALSNE